MVSGPFGLLIPLTGPGARVAFYLAGSAVVAAGILVGNIIAASFRQDYCPPSMIGRVTTGMRFLSFGGVPTGALAAGGLAAAMGVRQALWVVVAADAVTGTLLLTRAIRSAKNLPSCPMAQA